MTVDENIAAYSLVCANFGRAPVSSRWVRKAQQFWNIPDFLTQANAYLAGPDILKLPPERALELDKAIQPAYSAIKHELDHMRPGVLPGLLLRHWFPRMREETERMGDLLESLAWGSDTGPRSTRSASTRRPNTTHSLHTSNSPVG